MGFEMHAIRWSVLLLMAGLLCVSVAAEESAPPAVREDGTRPRVGLVLGGGGARGAAHVGVLKELERLRVPIDAIAGTSMGAAIGGLYASGMSASEIEELVSSLDWVAVLSDDPQRRDLPFRRKEDDEKYPADLELGLRDGQLLLPKGVIQGHKLALLLRELTFDVWDVDDFDALPTPYRAVSSDIERGEAFIIKSGSLARAMRASMAVPGIFAPVRIGKRMLVDGGLVGNLPVAVMQDMDVDVIIAVNVEFPLYKIEQLESAVTISEQMLTILIRQETLRQVGRLSADDILITPELGVFGSADFARIVDNIEPGVAAARVESAKLERLAVDEQTYTAYVERRARREAPADALAFVRVLHDGQLAHDVFQTRVRSRPGQPFDARSLAADADRLHGLNLYEQVTYELLEEDGATGVEFHARTKSWGPNILRFGVALEDDLEGVTSFNVAARLTRPAINRFGAELRADLQLGTAPLLLAELYQPLGARQPLFIAPRVELRQTNINAFEMDEKIARLRLGQLEGGLDVGAELGGGAGELRLGMYRGIGRASRKVGDPDLPDIDFETGGLAARLRVDTLDDTSFPHSGLRADLRWNLSRPSFGADDRFETFEAEFTKAWTRGKTSLQLGASYATTFDADEAIQDFFPLGGFLRLSGLDRGEIAGPHAALAKLVVYRRAGDTAGGLFDVPIYLGMSAEAGNVWPRRSDISTDTLRVSGSLFAGFDTLIGPVYFAAGLAEGGRTNLYLFIGSLPR